MIDDFDLEGFTRVAAAFGTATLAYAVTPNVDHLIRYHEDPKFRECYRDATFVLLDSRFVARVLALTRGLRLPVCTGSDLTARLLARVARPTDRIVIIGGTGAQARLITERFGLRNLLHYDPPMGFIHDRAAVEQCLRFIEAAAPFRFCFLAVGAPQQEALAQQLAGRGLARGLVLCVGASLNFVTGVEQRAPRWMQRLGIEWLYRLLQDPRRLYARYLIRGPRIFRYLRSARFELRRGDPATAVVPPRQSV